MQRNQHDKDDLKYLAEQGFEQAPVTMQDEQELLHRIRRRVSVGSNLFLVLSSLLAGLALGITAFFLFYPKQQAPTAEALKATAAATALPERAAPVLSLDTVIVKENFIIPKVKRQLEKITGNTSSPVVATDSAIVIPARELDLSALLLQPVKEEKLKYMPNAPVVYIHDLKVSDYRNLYFKKNRFVKVNGTAAPYAGREEAGGTSTHLKEEADYFLHEELAQALLYFKKGNYDLCIRSLDVVSTYNKEDVNCDFYLGMCYCYKRSYAKAISYFDKCIGSLNNVFLQEAAFYKAICLYESGNKVSARELFGQIAGEGEFYRKKAEEYLELLPPARETF